MTGKEPEGREELEKGTNRNGKYDFNVDVSAGRYIVDGRSIMGVFSIDLSQDLTVTIHTDDEEKASKYMEAMGKILFSCKLC